MSEQTKERAEQAFSPGERVRVLPSVDVVGLPAGRVGTVDRIEPGGAYSVLVAMDDDDGGGVRAFMPTELERL